MEQQNRLAIELAGILSEFLKENLVGITELIENKICFCLPGGKQFEIIINE